MNQHLRIGAAALALAALAAAAPAGAASKSTPAATPAAGGDLGKMSSDLQALSRRVGPGVVQIYTSGLTPGPGDVAGGLLSRQRGTGSGVILSPDGVIVTNAHVVDGATRVVVELAGPRPGPPGLSSVKASGVRMDATIVGVDQESDLAVLQVEGKGLPTLPFGDSDALQPGQLVMAFGSSLGFGGSVSIGVVSAVARQIEPDAPMIYVQTDTDIHPGNSGGPLVDVQGRVVGINTFIIGSPAGEAIGFAAPSNIVAAVVAQIRKNGRVVRGEIGANAQSITPELARGLKLSRDWGAILSDVAPNGPAAAAGLKTGDIVLELDGKPMENGRQLEVNLYRRAAGETVAIEVERDGEKKAIQVQLAERPAGLDRMATMMSLQDNLLEPLGILAVEVNGMIARAVPMREPWGVLVVRSTQDAPPGGRPLVPGDVIRAIDRTSVRTIGDARKLLAAHKTGDWVALQVERRGLMTYVPVEMP